MVLVCLYWSMYVLEDICVGLWECGVNMMGVLVLGGFYALWGGLRVKVNNVFLNHFINIY